MKYRLVDARDNSLELELPEHLYALTMTMTELCQRHAAPWESMVSLLLAFRAILACSGPEYEEWTQASEDELVETMRHNFEVCLKDGLVGRKAVREGLYAERQERQRRLRKLEQAARKAVRQSSAVN